MNRSVYSQAQNNASGVRSVVVTALVSVLAAGAVTGCSTSSTNRYAKGDNLTRQGQALRATASIDPSRAEGRYSEEFYRTEADRIALPDRWLSEAQTAGAESEARRAAAQAAEIKAFADQAQAFAFADAERRGAMTQQEIGSIDADKLRQVYNAKIAEEVQNNRSAAVAAGAQAAHRNQTLAAQVLEWQSDIEKMRAAAGSDWQQAQSEHVRMLAERSAVAERGSAQVAHMTKVADMTQERAQSQSAALRAEARAVIEKAQAEAQQIAQQIDTVTSQTQARSAELTQQIESVNRESSATVAQLVAQANALEAQDVNEMFRLNMATAESGFDRAKAEAQRLLQASDARAQEARAQSDRMRAEADKQVELDRNDYESSLASIRAFVDHGKADIAVRRVQAMKIEKDARASFVKAEVEARTGAVREQSTHQFVLAEEEARRIRAEAEAEATRLRAQFVETFAKQLASGQVEMPGVFNNDPKQNKPTSGDANPSLKKAGARNPVVEPEYVARFKASLAESEKIRVQADADERALFATAEERAASFEQWWRTQQTRHDAALAQADATFNQSTADNSQHIALAEGQMKQADIVLARAQSEAEAQRTETLARITNLKGEAELVARKGAATLAQLRAQLEAVERNGQSELQSLQVALVSTRERGDAANRRLLAEADALERTQSATVAQLRKEIETTRQIMTSELARLQQAADSFYAVAQANYTEAVSNTQALAEISKANTGEAIVSNQTAHQVALAEVEFRNHVTDANRLLADAQVNRRTADANLQFALFDSQDSINRNQIAARTQMALAASNAQFRIAGAEDESTFARFNARVAMTHADRNRAFADLYLDTKQKEARVQQAIAAASAYREMSAAAMNKLNEQTRSFEVAAKDNWFSGLALPANFPYPDAPSDLYSGADQTLNNQPIADAPVDND
ncbi:MAG TPA: hypothetical protein DEB06_10025 [Phycisphaerales bacterium]|nr:hypothetical protein [Phycisphaerales bacterium]